MLSADTTLHSTGPTCGVVSSVVSSPLTHTRLLPFTLATLIIITLITLISSDISSGTSRSEMAGSRSNMPSMSLSPSSSLSSPSSSSLLLVALFTLSSTLLSSSFFLSVSAQPLYPPASLPSFSSPSSYTPLLSSSSPALASPGRYLPGLVVRHSDLIVYGGCTSAASCSNDVWASKDGGSTWTQQTSSAGWSGRAFTNTGSMTQGGRIIVGPGGTTTTTGDNDVWFSDGTNNKQKQQIEKCRAHGLIKWHFFLFLFCAISSYFLLFLQYFSFFEFQSLQLFQSLFYCLCHRLTPTCLFPISFQLSISFVQMAAPHGLS